MIRRVIEPEMIAFFDKKLEGNGLAQWAIRTKNARELFALAMEACVGIREEGGNNNGPLVKLLQETVGSAVKEPWCMSLVQTCLAYAEHKTGITSDFPVTEHCMTAWRTAPEHLRVKFHPRRGAIPIWNHAGGDSGHTGMHRADKGTKSFYTVEGNTNSGTSPNGKVERDGGGVYANVRSFNGSGSMKLKGFLKPF